VLTTEPSDSQAPGVPPPASLQVSSALNKSKQQSQFLAENTERYDKYRRITLL